MLEILIHLGNHLVKRNIEWSGVLFRSKTSFNCTLWNNKIPGWQGSKPRWMASLWNVPRQVFSGPWTSQVYWEMLFKQQDLLRCEETGVYCSRGFGTVFYKSGSLFLLFRWSVLPLIAALCPFLSYLCREHGSQCLLPAETQGSFCHQRLLIITLCNSFMLSSLK